MSHRFNPMAMRDKRRTIWDEAADTLVEEAEDVALEHFDDEVMIADNALRFLMDPSACYNARCPSGHVLEYARAEMLSLFGPDIVLDIETGVALTLPIVPYGECYYCSIERQRACRAV